MRTIPSYAPRRRCGDAEERPAGRDRIAAISRGGGVATIVDMDSLEVQVDVSENFISRVHAEQRAMIKLNAYPIGRYRPCHRVIPTADQSKATVKVRVAFEQRDARVLPQMGARVSFFEDQPKAVAGNPVPLRAGVTVPVAAIQAAATLAPCSSSTATGWNGAPSGWVRAAPTRRPSCPACRPAAMSRWATSPL